MLVQGLSGITKDLSKMSSKSAVKILAPKAQGSLFRWVALLTGSKNAIKGFGFLLGAVLLGQFGFVAVLYAIASILCAVLFVLCVAMPHGLRQGRKNAQFSDMWSDNSNINWLAL